MTEDKPTGATGGLLEYWRPWALLPDALAVLAGGKHWRGVHAAPTGGKHGGSVAVIQVCGVITHRGGWWSGVTTQSIRAQLRAALTDGRTHAIVLRFDSPGGEVTDIAELAAEIYAARSRKPIIAVADGLLASAAYWLAASAAAVWMLPSAQVGGVGVYTMHVDESKKLERAGRRVTLIGAGKYKLENNQYEQITAEGRAQLQSGVDRFYQMFLDDLRRGRGRAGTFGAGRLLMAADAKRQGLVDRVSTLDNALLEAAALGVLSGSR